MDVFGSFTLLLAFVCAVYAFIGGIFAIKTRHPLLVKSTRQAGMATRPSGQRPVMPARLPCRAIAAACRSAAVVRSALVLTPRSIWRDMTKSAGITTSR